MQIFKYIFFINKMIGGENMATETPMLDELEKGRWPSYVKELKESGYEGLVKLYELEFQEKRTHWIHGGIVSIPGYDAGVIGRLSDRHDLIKDSHTLRVLPCPGWCYNTKIWRKIADLWEKHGSGLINLSGSTADIQLVGTTTDKLVPVFEGLYEIGLDIGGSGPALRTTSACVGPARCEWAMYDTLDLQADLYNTYIDEMHRPRWPYKWKWKLAGCPNDCVAAIARADMPIIGTWRDEIQIDQEMVKEYIKAGLDINQVIARCPTGCMSWDGKELTIDNEHCVRCMRCINAMPKALKPGKKRGATIMLGARARGKYGAFLAWVLVPFTEMKPPYKEVKELTEAIWDWWDENGRLKERAGECVYRLGFPKFLKDIGLDTYVQQVKHPRANPFWFYWEE